MSSQSQEYPIRLQWQDRTYHKWSSRSRCFSLPLSSAVVVYSGVLSRGSSPAVQSTAALPVLCRVLFSRSYLVSTLFASGKRVGQINCRRAVCTDRRSILLQRCCLMDACSLRGAVTDSACPGVFLSATHAGP